MDNDLNKPTKKMSMWAFLIFGVIVIAIISYVLLNLREDSSSNNTPPATTNSNNSSQNPTPEPSGETATITFTDNGFEPSNLTVSKGSTITVENKSSNDLQFSSDNHPTHTRNPEMNLNVLEPGQSASFVASTPGTHGFHDHLDDSKTGTLIVEN